MNRRHAPPGYLCPFCGLIAGDVSAPGNRCELTDVVHQDPDLIVLMGINAAGVHDGHVMICPTAHHENLYTMPDWVLARIALMSREVARAMVVAWGVEGVSLRQHNEPAGDQHVWHYHQHLYPRFRADALVGRSRRLVQAGERARLAHELRGALRV